MTGAGGPLAVSIIKALRQSTFRPRIVATDADAFSVGLFRADAAYVLPHVETAESAYIERLQEICSAEGVAMVCFGSEIEMRRLAPSRLAIEEATGARLILNDARFVEAFADKWTTVGLLREQGLPVPDTILATDLAAVDAFLDRVTFPIIMKPRHGSGSKGVMVLHDRAAVALFTSAVPEPILQEMLLPDTEEYTVGVYKSQRVGYVGQIVLKRSMGAGLTYKAQVVRDEEIESVCRRIVESFDIWGPVNVQLRKTAAGVRVFEINMRFSSSAVMRAHFGFNEPELCVRDAVIGEDPPKPGVRPGYALRYWDEIYLEPADVPIEDGRRSDLGPLGAKIDVF